ncbi:MAG: nucleotidyltransferase family protein, partial [Bacteroidales bacterium]|nr:nucleotidyltransferase family protein [Bacteroidales bacterium]
IADAQKQVYRQHLKLTDYLRVRFENNDRPFTPIVLKGLSLARLYEKPWLRNLGDIDLYFASPKCEKWATDCVESWGTPVRRGKGSESSYVMGGVVVEHHGLLVHPHTIFRAQSRRLREWIENEMKKSGSTRSICLDGVEIRVLRPDLDLLQLLSHALKHCINEGIGLRQLCDIAMYLHANKDIIDGGKTLEVLRLFGLERWARLVFAFLVQWLGLAEGDLPYKVRNVQKQNIATLLDEVAKSGDLGFMDERVNGRPKGWKGKAFTARRIFTKAWRFLPYAPREIIAWLPTL